MAMVKQLDRGMDMYKDAIPEVKAVLIQFATVQEAFTKKERDGGWVFAGDKGRVVWFDAGYFTPSHIMTHSILKGQNGKLL